MSIFPSVQSVVPGKKVSGPLYACERKETQSFKSSIRQLELMDYGASSHIFAHIPDSCTQAGVE
jgi:hypothetical protein